METWLASGGGLLDDLGINLKVWAVQVSIFVATFLILSRILFGRVLDHMTRREDEARSLREQLARERADHERLAKEYEARMARVDQEAYAKLQSILKEALATASASVARAQAEAKAMVEQARGEIAREKSEASARLRAEVRRLTLAAVEKALQTPLDPAVHGAAVDRFISERS
jgi:F-type H+-transporting ATPase subunit b